MNSPTSSPSSPEERLNAYREGSTDSALWAEAEDPFLAWLILAGQAARFYARSKGKPMHSIDFKNDGLDLLHWADEKRGIDQSVHPAKRGYSVGETFSYAVSIARSWREHLATEAPRGSRVSLNEDIDFEDGGFIPREAIEADYLSEVPFAWAVREADITLATGRAMNRGASFESALRRTEWEVEPADVPARRAPLDLGVWKTGDGEEEEPGFRPRKRATAAAKVPSSILWGEDSDPYLIAIVGGDSDVCGEHRGTETGRKRHHRAGEPRCRGRSFILDERSFGEGYGSESAFGDDWAERGLSCQDLANLKRAGLCAECGDLFVSPGVKRPRLNCGVCSGADMDSFEERLAAFETESVQLLWENHRHIIPLEQRRRVDLHPRPILELGSQEDPNEEVK